MCKAKFFLPILAGLALLVGGVRDAHAVPVLTLSDGATTVVVTDNGAGDLDATVGAIAFVGSVGVFTTNITGGVTKPVIGTALQPHMDLVDQSVSSSAGGTLTITFSEDSFAGTLPGFGMAIGGTADALGSVSYSAYYDNANVLSGPLPLSGSAALIGSLGPFGPGAFSGSAAFATAQVPLYSLTQVVTVTHTGAGVSSFNAELQQVPLPASALLMALGSPMMVVFRRRKQAA